MTARGRLPVVVGGTMYYVQSLLRESLMADGSDGEGDDDSGGGGGGGGRSWGGSGSGGGGVGEEGHTAPALPAAAPSAGVETDAGEGVPLSAAGT